MTTGNTRDRRNRLAGFTLVATAAILGVASTAWACGNSMGWIKVKSLVTFTYSYADMSGQTSTGEGPVGSTIQVTGGQLKPKPAKYSLMFARPGSGLDCHTATEKLKSTAGVTLLNMTTNAGGKLDKDLAATGVQAYKAKIPADSPTGIAQICGREYYPLKNNTYTGHANFTIT